MTALNLNKIKDPFQRTVARATYDPDWFAEYILLCPNDPFQSELLNAIADLDRIKVGLPTMYNHEGLNRFSVRSCHGTGKTHAIGKALHWYNFTRKGRIPVTAPKERQVTTRVWPEFRKILGKSTDFYKQLIKVQGTRIEWCKDPDWCALVEAASQSENLSGLHDDNLMFLVEEASGVDENIFPAIEGSLSTEDAIVVLIGNPTRLEGEFYNSHKKPGTMELYYRMHVRPEDSPRVSEKYLRDMARKYGENSPIYIVRCLGDFAEMTANQLIAMSWIEDARNKKFEEDGSLPTKRLSIDVGDGSDESVITVAIHYDEFVFMLKQFCFSFPPAESPILLADAAEEVWNRFNMSAENDDDIVVDALGPGSGTAGELIRREYPTVIYKGGEASDNTALWANRRSQSYMVLRDHFRDKEIIISEEFFDDPTEWDDLIGQLTLIKTEPGDERVEKLEPKRKLPFSPNKADSMAMQFATQQPVMHATEFDPMLLGTTELNNYDGQIS